LGSILVISDNRSFIQVRCRLQGSLSHKRKKLCLYSVIYIYQSMHIFLNIYKPLLKIYINTY
jgi:hypothetical protein